MTEESIKMLGFHLNRHVEKEIDQAMAWARSFVRQLPPQSTNNMSTYIIASLVYVFEIGNERSNIVGEVLCDLFNEYNEPESLRFIKIFRFPVAVVYNVVDHWRRRNEMPVLFNLDVLNKEYNIIHVCAKKNDVDMLDFLLNNDININAADEAQKTALHVAASAGNLEMVRRLLLFGASIYCMDRSNLTPFHCAVYHNQFTVAGILQPEIVSGFRMNRGDTLLMSCIRRRMLTQVVYLIPYANWSSVNYEGQNALHVCAETGDKRIMARLLEVGLPLDMINARDYEDETPLYLAVLRNNYAMVEQLLAAGAEITRKIETTRLDRDMVQLIQQYYPNFREDDE